MALDDYSVVRLTRDGLRTSTIDNIASRPRSCSSSSSSSEIELGGYEHFMQKEIFEQPRTLRNCLRGRLDFNDKKVVLGGLKSFAKELVRSRRIIICAQGTALHAGMIGEYLFEDLAKIPTECEYASEFRYRNPIIEDGTVVVAVSQSGETADTLAALHEAATAGRWRSAWSTSSARASRARPTRACTCGSAPRSASRAPRRSSGRSRCSR
jgi:glucosamine--fructose-6-phosphate aminotransferase (isomerizing)